MTECIHRAAALPDMAYPLKGAPGLSAAKAGICHDLWVLGDDQGRVLTAQDLPALTGLELDFRFGDLVLRAPGMMRLDVPVDVVEDDDSACGLWQEGHGQVRLVDEGELAAAWFSRWLGRPVRLLKRLPA